MEGRGVEEYGCYVAADVWCGWLLCVNELLYDQAKELVEGAPKVLKKDVKKEEAQKLVEKLKEVGAKVELV